ncbi:MAG: Putative binding domain, N-terminal [Bacteriophage sp.]|nr:MAG: Putative binding domain, N-terminal [Bacteriophage sp.]
MAEIATWSAILNKTGLGKTSNECPTKAELLALNNGKDSNVDKVIVISNAASYGNNECVKLEDINAEQWIYIFQWDPNGNPSFNAPATGGTYPFGSYASNRVKQVNGVNTTISQSLANDVTKTSEGSWYTTDYDGNKGRIVPNNTSTNSKSITVTWTQKYSGKTIQATFTQAAGRKVYSSWSYNCRVDKTSFSYSGGQSNVTAKSASRTYTWNGQGSSYTESETATVRVSSPASISGNSISIPSNSGSARNFTVTFDFPTATDQTISISQEGGQVTYVDHLSIDPTTKNVPGTGSGFRLTVNANYDKYINGTYVENIRTTYTSAEVVEGTSSDITISGKTSSGCSISVAPNPNSSPRTFKIKFTYDTATPVYLTITQNSAEVTYPSSGIVFEHSTQQNSGYKTSTLSIGTVEGKGGNISFYIKSYRSRYVNGSLSSTETIKPTLILPSGVTETITNVSGYYFKVTITIPEHSKPASRTLTIRANQPNGLDRELVQTVQQSASTYEFGIRENSGDSLSTSLTYSGWPSSNSSFNRPVRVYSRKNGNQFLNWALSSNVDWITISGSGAGATFKVATNNSSSSRTGVITFTQGESGKTCTLTIVQEAGDVYEFYITDSDGNGHYTDFTFSAPSDGLVSKHVLNIISTHNGSPLSVDDLEEVHSEITDKLIGLVLTSDTQSPFRFRANITGAGTTVRTGADTYRQKPSGKTVILRVLQEAKINNFRLELSLNISNGNDQGTWGLFDTANIPHTSDFMYNMSSLREGEGIIIVDSVEGKITVNSLQSTTKDRGVGDNVYVWAYNSVRDLWLSIGNFRIEEGNNTHHWDVSWPT